MSVSELPRGPVCACPPSVPQGLSAQLLPSTVCLSIPLFLTYSNLTPRYFILESQLQNLLFEGLFQFIDEPKKLAQWDVKGQERWIGVPSARPPGCQDEPSHTSPHGRRPSEGEA